MNLDFQVRMHVAAHMRQWPQANRAEVARRIRAALVSGNAWLWHEPQQMDLFGVKQ